MPELRRDQFLVERMLRSAGDRQIAAAGERDDLQRILQALPPSTFPGTTVNASTFSSGEFRASRMAIASSMPGSVSMMTRCGSAAVDVKIRITNTGTK